MISSSPPKFSMVTTRASLWPISTWLKLTSRGDTRISAKSNLTVIRSTFSEEAVKILDTARRQLAEFTPRLSKFEDNS